MTEEFKLFSFTIKEEDFDHYNRLDQYLSDKIEDISRSALKEHFKNGHITSTNLKKVELKKLPAPGTKIDVKIPPPREADAKPENIPLDIIYEDEFLLFVNKPAGMVVHPAPGNYDGTLVNAILYHCKDLKGVGDQKRPGIVHRLDKGTSGVMVVAKESKCHEGLVKLFSTHDIDRVYNAIVMGDKHPIGGTINAPIGRHPQNRLKMAANVKNSKEAITYYKTIEYFHKHCLMELKLETGRTHQIRVHLSQILRSSILNDPLYGNPKEHLARLGSQYQDILKSYEHPFLHAKVLGLNHPITKKKLVFEVDPPHEFQSILNLSRSESESKS